MTINLREKRGNTEVSKIDGVGQNPKLHFFDEVEISV